MNYYTLLSLIEVSHVSVNKTSITLRDFTLKSKRKSTKKYEMYCMQAEKYFSYLLVKK